MAFSPPDIVSVFRAVHGCDPAPDVVARLQSGEGDLGALVRKILDVEPPAANYRRSAEYREHNGARFGVPRELQVTPTPLKRVLLAGYCLLERWPHKLKQLGVMADIDHVLLSGHEPTVAPHPAKAYSFEVVHLPTRGIVGDLEMFAWIHAGYGALKRSDALLDKAKANIDRLLKFGTLWRDRMPIFVTTIVGPQQEFNGRLIDRRGSDSILVFFDRINAYLRDAVAELDNVYLIDVNEIMGVIGRRRLLDDTVVVSAHGAVLSNGFAEEDAKRLIPSRLPTEYYDIRLEEFLLAVWFEAEAMYRTLRQIDQVKMVCVDLDDTLWRGVLAEEADVADVDIMLAREGWPLGLVEALAILKRRGVLLCLVSKNSEARVRAIFAKVYRDMLSLDDFAIVKINWAPKTENIREALAETNLLPRSVVFLDDNPAERAAVKQAFPDIRVIEAPHYYWKRILLWSAETQTATLTNESVRRTEMVQAQVRRETSRGETSHEDFLAGLGLRVEIAAVAKVGKRFARALELLNKSNQFNTTGRRWSAQELAETADRGGVIVAAVADRFTDYGDTLVAIVADDRIEQLVMSCRVISLGVELAAVAVIARHVLARHSRVAAKIVESDANVLARDLFRRCGWILQHDEWSATSPGSTPDHIRLVSAL